MSTRNDRLVGELEKHFPADRLKTRWIDLHAYSSDASFYTLVPKAVVFPVDLQEIRRLFQLAQSLETSVTFRTAGTSLSGQAVTEGILVDLSRYWPLVKAEAGGDKVRVQPGVIGSVVNHVLKPYGRKMGPDPASIGAAMMGGILSNNSSGMCCGVVDNSYHTMLHMKFVLADGSLWDTEAANESTRFEREKPELAAGLSALRQRIRTDETLSAKIRGKYKIKNTVGYGLNAFIDHEHPLDILAHLMIGAEGTLGFIAEAVLRTIPDKPYKRTALLFFDSPKSACDAVPLLRDSGAEALEFMDRAALRSIEELPVAPAFIKGLGDRVSCLLCEYQADSLPAVEQKLALAERRLSELSLIQTTGFTADEHEQAIYWKLRKGMYPSVAAVRAKGTSVMLEDIAVSVEKLGEAIEALQELFARFGYDNALVFGHAKDGNLHFLVSQSIATAEDIAAFGAFNDALAALVIGRFDGAIKAEHGTGRQVAPYVEQEWGPAAYQVMVDLKRLLDPANIVNPGVILNEDKEIHLKNLKSLPVVEAEVDKCVECGYCESSCPSRLYTVTPRQRIVLRRSLARLRAAGNTTEYEAVLKDYQFDGMDSCAVDGMCANNCPVNINTGELIKRLRRENHKPSANRMALRIAKNFGLVEGSVKTALRLGNGMNAVFGRRTMTRITDLMRKIAPAFPRWTPQLTGPIKIGKASAQPTPAEAVYFVTCITRMMGQDIEKRESIVDVFLRVAERAGIKLIIPAEQNGACCGQAFSSKGFVPAYAYTVNQTIEKLWSWTGEGRLPVVMDISSCTHSLHGCRPHLTEDNQKRFDKLRIMDSLEFAVDVLAPKLTIVRKTGKTVFHPVCSLHKMGLYQHLVKLGRLTAEEPVIPFQSGCCGMAGDRGFYYPGLTEAAGRAEGAEASAAQGSGYYSTGKTCEMAMSESAGHNYRSVLYLLDEVSAG